MIRDIILPLSIRGKITGKRGKRIAGEA